MIALLKVLGSAATIAVVALWETGECWYALLIVPGLVFMWIATRQRAKRRAREGVRA